MAQPRTSQRPALPPVRPGVKDTMRPNATPCQWDEDEAGSQSNSLTKNSLWNNHKSSGSQHRQGRSNGNEVYPHKAVRQHPKSEHESRHIE